MRLYFIRHAQSENNVIIDETRQDPSDPTGKRQYEQRRYPDAPLSTIGRQQVTALERFVNQADSDSGRRPFPDDLSDPSPTHLYASPMIRTLDTAVPLAKAWKLIPIVWETLCEQGGVWQVDPESGRRQGLPGTTPSALRQRYASFVFPETMNVDGWWNRPYETPDHCYQRAGLVLEQLMIRHRPAGDRVVLVGHSFFFNCFLYQLYRLPISTAEFRFAINNTAITRIDFDTNLTRLVYHNRVDFLPPELLTV